MQKLSGARVLVVGFALILAFMLWVAATVAAAPVTPGSKTTVNVPANQAWTDTGLDVKKGDRFRIEATGVIKIAASDPGKTPDGDQNCGASNSFVAPGLHCYALIAKIGNGDAVEVGRSSAWEVQGAQEANRLYLGVNDEKSSFGDNSGAWTADITLITLNGQIRSPFDSSQTWYVCRGYNTKSHVGKSAYALDFIIDKPVRVSPSGCTSDNFNASSGQPVYAPVPGRTSACWGSDGVNAQFVCVQSSSPTSNGYYFIIGHVDPNSRLLNTDVQAGRQIGRLAPAGKLGLQIAHIHMEARPELGKQSVPFTLANGTRICQQDFPSNGTQGGVAVRGCS